MSSSPKVSEYDHKKIEAKWQKKWEDEKLYRLDMDKVKKPFYNLMMFPYPSAEGLHVGGVYTFTGVDTFGRYKRMQGYDVFEPIGLDGFGIHSENFAMKIGEHIKDVSVRTEKNFYRQLSSIGNMFDWSRTVETYKPEYYKWTQWIFLQLFKKGLAYQKKAKVNWCPSCKTVLSDEQVIQSQCERCDSVVEKKELKQWFFKITAYAERLLENSQKEDFDWPADVKLNQQNWIGRSEGAKIRFEIKATGKVAEQVEVFTTRPDTLFGATYMVIAPEHELISKFKEEISNFEEVEAYVTVAVHKSEQERKEEEKEKTGVEIQGVKAINPVNGEELPIFVADYVLAGYGTGAIMAVPAHDERDWEFAKKYDLPIKQVVLTSGSISGGVKMKSGGEVEGTIQGFEDEWNIHYSNQGIAVNSDFLDGLKTVDAKKKIVEWLEEKGVGEKSVDYKLRDWCVSRQRYWGPPIPVIHCEKCGVVPVPEKDLPVELPPMEDFLPEGTGKGPLAKLDSFVKTKCPVCGGEAERETDVSDPFVDSAWYFLRYPSTEFDDVVFDKERTRKWLPVDSYIGGKEHTVLHLLYSRFITMVLHDLGYLDFDEPYKRFFGHGLITKDGAKMSKSKGNVINPDEMIEKYGADTTRLYLRFLGDFSQGGDWRDSGAEGMNRFVKRTWNLFFELTGGGSGVGKLSMMHKTIKAIGDDLERLSFNTAVARLMEYVNWLKEQKDNFSEAEALEVKKVLTLVIAPMAPHLAEELWQSLGNKDSVFNQSWPKYDAELIMEDQIELVIQVNGKLRDKMLVKKDITKEEAEKLALNAENIAKYLEGKPVKKIIFIAGRLLNIVI